MSGDTECLICFQEYDTDTAWTCTNCNQKCHQFCIEEWFRLNPTCPFCRHEINISDLIYITQRPEFRQFLDRNTQIQQIRDEITINIEQLPVQQIIQKLEKYKISSFLQSQLFFIFNSILICALEYI